MWGSEQAEWAFVRFINDRSNCQSGISNYRSERFKRLLFLKGQVWRVRLGHLEDTQVEFVRAVKLPAMCDGQIGPDGAKVDAPIIRKII